MEQFVVIAAESESGFEDCQVIAVGEEAINEVVFGPASKEVCESWIAENCRVASVSLTEASEGPQMPLAPTTVGGPLSRYLPSADTSREIESNKGKIIALGAYLLIVILISIYSLAGLMMAETDKERIDARLRRVAAPTPSPTATSTPNATPTALPTSTPAASPATSPTGSGNVDPAAPNSASSATTKTPTPTPMSTPVETQNLVKADIPAEVYIFIPLIVSGSLSADGYLVLIVVFSGMLGAAIRATYSFVGHLGFRNFAFSWTWFYITLPLTGSALALVIYLVLRGGFYGGQIGNGLVLNLFAFAALAALTGLFTEHAMEKLKQVATTLLSDVSPKVENARAIVETKEAEKANK